MNWRYAVGNSFPEIVRIQPTTKVYICRTQIIPYITLVQMTCFLSKTLNILFQYLVRLIFASSLPPDRVNLDEVGCPTCMETTKTCQ
jgi:hypothetical protein